MSGLSKRKHRQERAQCERETTIPLLGLRCLQDVGCDRPLWPGAQGGNLAGLSEAYESAGYFTDFRRVASHRDRLAKNTPAIAEGA